MFIVPDSFQKKIFVLGLPIITLKQEAETTTFSLGPIPLFKIVNHGTKICVNLGPIELFKIRYKGVRPLPIPHPSFVPVERTTKKIFFDIGELHKKSGQYGIARTAFELFKNLRKIMPESYKIYPVYFRSDRAGYFYANRYLRNHFCEECAPDFDFPIEFSRDDIIFQPVPEMGRLSLQKTAIQTMRQNGVKVFALFHDLIPLSHPQFVTSNLSAEFHDWIQIISEFDGIIANSKSSAEEYRAWRKKNWNGSETFSIDWFHLGADFKKYSTSKLPDEAKHILDSIQSRPSLLEVSTVEPRKGHKQTLAAFELLWNEKIDINYIIVGNKGWMMDDFCQKLEKHPEFGKHLFWLRGINDAYLDAVYDAAAGVIMPSETEGFGLAIIEGAHHGKPLILRDIPVFRELAGSHATYFTGLAPEPLAECIKTWLDAFNSGNVPSSAGVQPLTWEDSARMLLSRLPLTL